MNEKTKKRKKENILVIKQLPTSQIPPSLPSREALNSNLSSIDLLQILPRIFPRPLPYYMYLQFSSTISSPAY